MQSLIVLVKGFQQTRVQRIWLHNSMSYTHALGTLWTLCFASWLVTYLVETQWVLFMTLHIHHSVMFRLPCWCSSRPWQSSKGIT